MSEAANDDDSPRVQIPLSAEYHGLSIDGEFVNAIPDDRMDDARGFMERFGHIRDYLPPEASRAYWGYYNTDNSGHVQQCQECGYLSMSKQTWTTAKDKLECNNCGSTKWRRVYPRDSLATVPDEHKDKVYVDVLALDADDVPNAKSHLSRIQNELSNYVSKKEMLEIVAAAVKEARERGDVDY